MSSSNSRRRGVGVDGYRGGAFQSLPPRVAAAQPAAPEPETVNGPPEEDPTPPETVSGLPEEEQTTPEPETVSGAPEEEKDIGVGQERIRPIEKPIQLWVRKSGTRQAGQQWGRFGEVQTMTITQARTNIEAAVQSNPQQVLGYSIGPATGPQHMFDGQWTQVVSPETATAQVAPGATDALRMSLIISARFLVQDHLVTTEQAKAAIFGAANTDGSGPFILNVTTEKGKETVQLSAKNLVAVLQALGVDAGSSLEDFVLVAAPFPHQRMGGIQTTPWIKIIPGMRVELELGASRIMRPPGS